MGVKKYSKNHIWVKETDGKLSLGISAFAQQKLGSVMFLNLPDIGDILEAGRKFGDIESIKTVSDLISPIDGEVAEVNEVLLDDPDAINEDAEVSWFIKAYNTEFPDDLLTEEQYSEYCKTL